LYGDSEWAFGIVMSW